MGRNLGKNFPPALQRISDALGEGEIAGIATALGVPYGTVRNWHQRGTVSLTGLKAAAQLTGRSIEWFIDGGPDGAKNFAPVGLEVNLMRGGDAFGQGQKVTKTERSVDLSPRAAMAQAGAPQTKLQQNVVRYDAAKVDPGLLSGVLAAVLEELRARGLELPTEKLAELVALVYEDLSGPQADDADQPNQAQRTAKRYLRLVA